jgi:hypothetical protein
MGRIRPAAGGTAEGLSREKKKNRNKIRGKNKGR